MAALAGAVAAVWLSPANATAAAGPIGQLQAADCAGIEGWTQDPDLPLDTTDAHIYFNGPAGDPAASAIVVTADRMQAGGCEAAACEHGFVSGLPMSLLDDVEHVVHAYGIDLSGDPNLELEASPATFQCPPPPIVGGELRHVTSPEVLAAWQFSTFFDRLLVDDAVLLALPEVSAIDPAPVLAVADTSDPTVWLVDGPWRRFVDPAFMAAWRFDPTTAIVMPVDELEAMPEGAPLRARPVLVQGTGDAVYLLDDHSCTEGDTNAACVDDPPEPAGSDGDGGTDDDGGDADSDGSGASTGSDDGGSSAGPDTDAVPLGADGTDDADGGCGCRSTPRDHEWLVLALLALPWRRGRRRPDQLSSRV